MLGCRRYRYVGWMLGMAMPLIMSAYLHADPVLYEPGVDPGVGFNLISWSGSTTSTQWINAINALDAAGFAEVSISPLRFVELDNPATSGSLFSTGTPSLAGISAGIAHAKSLGMRVTVNPFVEPEGFAFWRGQYNPSGAEATRFWNDYTSYLTEVATIAQSNGADSILVGTELKAIESNSAHNASWTSAISAVDAIFTNGTLGYAANWDNYQHTNLRNTIWENPAIDFLGIDSYFQNLLNTTQADNSGEYPNIDFITDVEDAWSNKLDNEILPYAAARKGGAGMPVEFTEIGYLPRNRTTVTPQGNTQPFDQDEQNMAFEGFMRALDGRLASGEFLAAHIWQWNMSGSGGSEWNMDPSGGDQPANQQTAQWLSSFVQGTNPDPGDPPPPPPPGATTVLYSFEDGLDGFQFPGFSGSTSSLAQVTGTGNTDGDDALRITKTDDDWTWDARVFMAGEQLQAMQEAIADNIADYVLEIDVSYVAGNLPASLTDMNMHISFQSQPGFQWGQAFPFADIGSAVSQSFHVEIPLNSLDNANTLIPGISGLAFHIGFDGTWPNGQNASVYIDRIALTDLTFVPPENANFDGDDDVDGEDFLAWQRGYGITNGAALEDGDANGDGAVNELDLEIWEQQYGTTGLFSALSSPVPEPAAFLSALLAFSFCAMRRRS